MQRAVLLMAMAGVLVGSSHRLWPEPKKPRHPSKREPMTEESGMDPIRGRTLRWTWTEGPTAGTTHEHVFGEDGSVVWRVIEGPQKGKSAQEKEYAVVRVADDVYAVSYLAASGYTLTVVLNFKDKRMVGFASGEKAWYPGKGTFEVLDG